MPAVACGKSRVRRFKVSKIERLEQRTLLSANLPPQIIGPYEFTVLSTSIDGTFIGSVEATDPDPDTDPDTKPEFPVAFQLIGGNTDAFSIDADTGALKVKESDLLPSISAPQVLTVKVTDKTSPEEIATASIIIYVNHPPVLSAEAYDFSEIMGSNVLGTLSATDSDAGQQLTFTFLAGNDDGTFAIDNSGKLTIANQANFNGLTLPKSLAVRVQDDSSRQGNDTATVIIRPNLTPSIFGATLGVLSIAEIGSLVGQVSASEGNTGQSLAFSIANGNNGAFAIDSQGRITVVNPALLSSLEPETSLSVTVTDNGVPAKTASAVVEINLNHPPVIVTAIVTVPATAVSGTKVGTVVTTDVDADQALSYSISDGNDSGAFVIDSETGEITVGSKTAFDALHFPVTLTVEVVDDGLRTGSDEQEITVSLLGPEVNDNQILFRMDPATRTYQIGDEPVRLDPQAVFRPGSQVPANFSFNNAELTIKVLNLGEDEAKGKLSIDSDDRGKGRISVAGKSILFGDTVIGKFDTSKTDGPELKIQFNQSATAALIQALLRRIGLKSGGAGSTREVELTFSDVSALPGALSTQTKTINIIKKVRHKG